MAVWKITKNQIEKLKENIDTLDCRRVWFQPSHHGGCLQVCEPIPAKNNPKNNKNHQFCQNGGCMVMFTETPVSFQTPSLFEPFTLNV